MKITFAYMDRCLRVSMEAAKRDPVLAQLVRRALQARRDALREGSGASTVVPRVVPKRIPKPGENPPETGFVREESLTFNNAGTQLFTGHSQTQANTT